MTKRFGFTLAEVLVTLTIIGVVASMTVPTLMNSTSTQEYSAGLKKMMSTLNQAITMQYALDGTDMRQYPSVSGENAFDDTDGVAKMLMDRLQVVSTTTSRGGNVLVGTKSVANNNAALYLSDGMVIEFPSAFTQSATCKANATTVSAETGISAAAEDECLYSILVDVNGDKGKCFASDQKKIDDKGKNKKINPGDCFLLDVYSDGVKPADWIGQQVMFNAK